MRCLFLVAFLIAPTTLGLGQNPVQTQDEEPPAQNTSPGVDFNFKDRPSLRIGSVRLDLKTKWQFDFRQFDPSIANPPVTTDTFILKRARFAIKGNATKYFNYEVEREMRGTFGDEHERHPWKDVYVEFRPSSVVRLKAGKFKMPFGMEENTSPDSLDFVYRSRVTNFLAPARERGAMLNGKLLRGKRLGYELGVFRFDGENSNVQGIPTAGRTYAGRLSGEPLRYLNFLPKTIRHTYLGVAATGGEMFEGENGIHGQTISNFTYFDHVFVKGTRRRTGVEVAWSEGPFGVKGEYIHVSEQRKMQGIRENDLPDKVSRGWYVTAQWAVAGEMKSNGKEPTTPLLTGRGFGAVELAARLDVLSFYSADGSGLPSRSPRAANILPNSDRTWTFGSTWYLNHFVKVQANAEREWLADITKEAVAGRSVFWTTVFRLQLAM